MSARPPGPAALRRIALSHQGLLGARRMGRGPAGMRKTLDRLGYVQIDTISVVARAHHHTFWSRVSGYQDEQINRLIRRGEAFEYWAHAAAFLPMRDYRFALPVMNAYRRGEEKWVRSRDPKLMRAVLDRVREEGPLRVRDFETPKRHGTQAWWNWKPAKGALEQLFMQGDLMSVGRDGLEKIYDLPERVLPRDVATVEPSTKELAAHLVDLTLRAHGFAVARTFTYGIRYGGARSKATRAAVRDVLDAGVRSGELTSFEGRHGERFFGRTQALARRPGKPPDIVRILSPFDNSVIHRDRVRGIFDFDFVFECYVTEAKRRFGYYCLPILFGDTFVGRMDCKAHRAKGLFEIKHLYVERPLPESFDAAFGRAVWEYARLTGCDDVHVSDVTPARDKPRIERCLMHTPST